MSCCVEMCCWECNWPGVRRMLRNEGLASQLIIEVAQTFSLLAYGIYDTFVIFMLGRR